MDRKEFFAAIGMSSFVTILTCMGCSKSSSGGGSVPPVPSGGVDFTIDLTAASNAALLNKGGYIAINGILVAHTLNGNYIAVQQSCTHENYPLVYDGAHLQFYCNNHGATFTETGTVTGGPTNRSLTTFKTQLTASSLRIYS